MARPVQGSVTVLDAHQPRQQAPLPYLGPSSCHVHSSFKQELSDLSRSIIAVSRSPASHLHALLEGAPTERSRAVLLGSARAAVKRGPHLGAREVDVCSSRDQDLRDANRVHAAPPLTLDPPRAPHLQAQTSAVHPSFVPNALMSAFLSTRS
eukprot:763860-Hanusia_phi.AAC.3